MIKKAIIAVLAVLCVMSVLSYNTYAQRKRLAVSAKKAIILFAEGDVKAKLGDWKNAEEGMILKEGDELKTGVDSWAEVGFGMGYENVVRVEEMTLIKFIDLSDIKLSLLKGELRSLVEKIEKDSTFEIRTPSAVCGARGTGWDTNTDGTKVVVDVYEDEVYFEPQSAGAVDPRIGAGKRGILEDPTKKITIKDVPLEKIKDWNKWKEGLFKRMGMEKRGIKGKMKTLNQAQKSMQDMMKAQQKQLDKKGEKLIDERLESPHSSGSTNTD
jgi:hypothetical protein